MSDGRASPTEQSASRLIVWETGDAVYVGWENSTDDWVACLEKRAGFPAYAWAQRMSELYNRGERQTPTAHDPIASYSPQ